MNVVERSITDAQKRIERAEGRLAKYGLYCMIMDMGYDVEAHCKARGIDEKDVPTKPICETFVENQKNTLLMLKVEMMIYNALLNKKTKRAIYPLLKQKYEEHMLTSYELAEKLVALGGISEGDWIEYAKDSLEQKEYIMMMCGFAERGALPW
jgi:hypothetical protein